MEAFALYLTKSTVWLTGFALVYLLFLRNERFFLLNRIYLVAGILVSIVFPLFTWHYTVVVPVAPAVEVSELQMMGPVDIPEPFPTQAILLYIYLAGALYLLFRITLQTLTVMKVIRKSEIHPYPSAKLIRTTEYPGSFSFFSFVFVNPSTCDIETNEIVNHEMEHVRQQHWIDLLLFEIICTLQWFNPMSWLYGRFIRQNHEFLADERALQRSSNPGIYRAALLNQLFGGPVISLANSFNYSINNKRFHMMKKTIYSPIRKFKLLLVLPLIAGIFYAFATPEYKYDTGTENQDPKQALYTISKEKVDISFTPQLDKIDLEAIKAELAKIGMTIDYTSLNFSLDGKLKEISAKINGAQGSVSFNSNKLTSFNYPVFRSRPNEAFGIYFSTSVKGTVYKPDGSPLPSATVIMNGNNRSVGTVTNQDGEFELSIVINQDGEFKLSSIPRGSEVVISYVGYQTEKLKVEADKPMIVNMKAVNIGIDEVAVVAIGDNSPKSSSIQQPFEVHINDRMQFGKSGGSVTQPLIVINGKITENQDINNIDRASIESITVLKGESAIALYGDKGKNDVISITLKDNVVIGYGPNNQQITSIKQPFEVHTNDRMQFRHSDGSKTQPLVVINGEITEDQNVRNVDPETIQLINVLRGESAIKKYGDKGKNGVIEVTLKKGYDIKNEPRSTSGASQDQKDNTVFKVVEQMPEFPGGAEALRRFIATNVKYPALAHQNGIQGKVYVTFVVTKTGSVANARVVRGIDPSLDQEAIRVVNLLPAWEPGIQGGEKVDVEYTIPINFVLQGGKTIGSKTADGQAYLIVEEMPEFPGGDAALRQFIATTVKYPAEAHQNGIQGKVFVSFVVTKTGSIANAKVARGVDPLLDQEALRVVNLLPTWKPGKQKGENVDVAFAVPINFALEPSKISDEQLKGTDNPSDGVFIHTDQMPEFPGGDAALRNFIASNVKYPAEARQKGIHGKVYINFMVTKTGSIANAKVARGVDPSLDQEAIRVVESLPTWIPGKNKGENVAVSYTVPINFALEKDTNKDQAQTDPTVQKKKLIIVPNPTQSIATVTLEGSDSTNKLEVSIFSNFGKLISKETKNGPSFTLSVSNLTPGTYLVVAVDGSTQYQGQMVVNH